MTKTLVLSLRAVSKLIIQIDMRPNPAQAGQDLAFKNVKKSVLIFFQKPKS